MTILIHPTYFPNIAHFAAFVQADSIAFEICDSYQKQTYRNRTQIATANGKIALSVPLKFSQKNRQLFKDVRIASDEKWQSHHWKSLQSAYKTSPFFEYYEDDLAPLFHLPYEFIMDFNFKCMEVVLECLQYEKVYSSTSTFEKSPTQIKDLRFLTKVRKEQSYQFEAYTQVFSTKNGFLTNLSILDLLFNEGPNAINYLQNQPLDFLLT